MRTRLATTSHTSHAASSASLTLPHRAKAAISETMEIAGTYFPARRYSSDTRWGRNSADRAESGAGSVAKFVFCVLDRTVQFWHKFGGRPRIAIYFRTRRAGPVQAGPALHVWPPK